MCCVSVLGLEFHIIIELLIDSVVWVDVLCLCVRAGISHIELLIDSVVWIDVLCLCVRAGISQRSWPLLPWSWPWCPFKTFP